MSGSGAIRRHPTSGAVRAQPPLAGGRRYGRTKAAKTRRKIYDMAVAEKLLIQAFHYPFPAAEYVEKHGTGYRLTPARLEPDFERHLRWRRKDAAA